MAASRRAFLGFGSWLAMQSALQAEPGGPQAANENYWKMLRGHYPLEDGLLYFNAANIAPASRGVLDRYHLYLRDFEANPAFQNREKYDPMREQVRAKLARLLHAEADEIAITRNTSEGTNTLITGLDLKAGDEIVISEHNHQCNNEAWTVRARRHGWVVRALPVSFPARSVDQIVDQYAKAFTPRTRVVGLTHVTNVTGLRMPVREIGEIARRRNIWVHVDGAQSFGALNVNLSAMQCDSYATSTHKWMMGPLEAGVLFVRKDRVAEVWPSIVTAGWKDDLKGARRLENLGQRDDARLAGIEAAADFLELAGMANVEARVLALARAFQDRVRELPVKVWTNREPELSAGVIKLSTGEANVRPHYDALWKRHRLAISSTASGPAHGLRFSPHIYNTMEDLDRAVRALKAVVS